jgi:hypothetical protein
MKPRSSINPGDMFDKLRAVEIRPPDNRGNQRWLFECQGENGNCKARFTQRVSTVKYQAKTLNWASCARCYYGAGGWDIIGLNKPQLLPGETPRAPGRPSSTIQPGLVLGALKIVKAKGKRWLWECTHCSVQCITSYATVQRRQRDRGWTCTNCHPGSELPPPAGLQTSLKELRRINRERRQQRVNP